MSAPCLRCGYDLQGHSPDGICPECGMGVARSLVPSDELRHAPPGWLAGLTWGAWLLLAPIVVLTLLRFLAFSPPWVSARVHEAILLALALTFAAGAWLVTRPQPRFGTTPTMQRWLIRATAGLQVAQIGAVGLGTTAGSIPLLLVAWFFSHLLAAFPALLMLHLRRLALRVLDPRLAEHCAIIGCGASAALLLLTASAFAPNWLFRGPYGRWFGYAEVFVAAVGLLCVLWSVLTLLRFALAFGKAWRASRDAWDAADASAVVPGNSAPIGHTGA